MQEFPRKARGLDYDLNWSLAGDKITTRGEAYRNASVKDLLEFLPRSGTSKKAADSPGVWHDRAVTEAILYENHSFLLNCRHYC